MHEIESNLVVVGFHFYRVTGSPATNTYARLYVNVNALTHTHTFAYIQSQGVWCVIEREHTRTPSDARILERNSL